MDHPKIIPKNHSSESEFECAVCHRDWLAGIAVPHGAGLTAGGYHFHGSDGLGGSFAQFTPVAYGFTLNSTDESAHLILPSVNIFDNDSGVQDVYTFSFDILPALFEGIDTALYSFNGDLVGPTTMFSAAALPGNLDFLSAVTASSSYWLTTTIPYEDDKPTSTTVGTFIATGPLTSGVPEPSSLVLLAVSLACMLFLMTRKRIAHGCPQST